MPKFEIGKRVYHTVLGYGVVVLNENYKWISANQVAIRFDIMPDPIARKTTNDDITAEERHLYGFNEDGTHFGHDSEVFRGTLSLWEEVMPPPDEWYQQVVE